MDQIMALAWWQSSLLILMGVLAEKVATHIRRRMAQPYSWQCPGCGFALKSSEKGLLLKVKQDHILRSHT